MLNYIIPYKMQSTMEQINELYTNEPKLREYVGRNMSWIFKEITTNYEPKLRECVDRNMRRILKQITTNHEQTVALYLIRIIIVSTLLIYLIILNYLILKRINANNSRKTDFDRRLQQVSPKLHSEEVKAYIITGPKVNDVKRPVAISSLFGNLTAVVTEPSTLESRLMNFVGSDNFYFAVGTITFATIFALYKLHYSSNGLDDGNGTNKSDSDFDSKDKNPDKPDSLPLVHGDSRKDLGSDKSRVTQELDKLESNPPKSADLVQEKNSNDDSSTADSKVVSAGSTNSNSLGNNTDQYATYSSDNLTPHVEDNNDRNSFMTQKSLEDLNPLSSGPSLGYSLDSGSSDTHTSYIKTSFDSYLGPKTGEYDKSEILARVSDKDAHINSIDLTNTYNDLENAKLKVQEAISMCKKPVDDTDIAIDSADLVAMSLPRSRLSYAVGNSRMRHARLPEMRTSIAQDALTKVGFQSANKSVADTAKAFSELPDTAKLTSVSNKETGTPFIVVPKEVLDSYTLEKAEAAVTKEVAKLRLVEDQLTEALPDEKIPGLLEKLSGSRDESTLSTRMTFIQIPLKEKVKQLTVSNLADFATLAKNILSGNYRAVATGRAKIYRKLAGVPSVAPLTTEETVLLVRTNIVTGFQDLGTSFVNGVKDLGASYVNGLQNLGTSLVNNTISAAKFVPSMVYDLGNFTSQYIPAFPFISKWLPVTTVETIKARLGTAVSGIVLPNEAGVWVRQLWKDLLTGTWKALVGPDSWIVQSLGGAYYTCAVKFGQLVCGCLRLSGFTLKERALGVKEGLKWLFSKPLSESFGNIKRLFFPKLETVFDTIKEKPSLKDILKDGWNKFKPFKDPKRWLPAITVLANKSLWPILLSVFVILIIIGIVLLIYVFRRKKRI